ncbi:hypothetical protein BGZ83_008484 [Gryganskiella cystojenkinii]|nr:hypothetical protein BGZ83_008484 [Gryganskiella cystojenkinii]
MMRHQPFSASALDSSYSDGSLLEGDDTTTITMSTTKIKHLKVLSPLSLQSIKDIFPLLNYCPELETLHLVPIRLRNWEIDTGRVARSLAEYAAALTGKMVQEMLCSLPNLDTLSVPWIQDLDLMLDPRPWVSVRLKQLEVCILFSQQSPSQRLLMERLATLRELKHLDVTMNRLHAQLYPSPAAASAPLYFDGRIIGGTVIQPTSFLRFGLGHGLHLLKVWRNLEGLSIDTPQEMTEADIRWILDHWPKLRYLYGSLHTESGQAKSLRDLLIKGGATYVASDPGMYISI